MPIRTFLGLLLANAIWSVHPIMGKWALADFSPLHVAWLRYTSAFIAYLVYSAFQRGGSFLKPRNPRHLLFVVLLGILPFSLGPLLQLHGLSESRATDNALIIAMEPLITVFMARIFLRERVQRRDLLAFAAALLGFILLSRWTSLGELTLTEKAALAGDFLMLLSLIGEASYTILGRNLSQQYPPTPIFGTASACGAIFLTIAVALSVGLPDFTHFTLRSAVAILWLGPLGTMGVYLYWIRTLAHAPVAGLALTLFLQPVLGAALSYLLLGERLEPIQILGGALIFSAVFWQAATRRSKKTD